jgi:PAS domain S-box-containing protein
MMMRDLNLPGTQAGESLPVMLWRARPDMSCEYLSPEWLEFTGYAGEQALGEGWYRGVHPEDLARWLDTCLRAFDAREPFEVEYRLRRRDGDYRWVLDRGLPRFAGGVFAGFVGACLDIHERKLAELELAQALERERRLRAALEAPLRLTRGIRVLIVDPDPAAREAMSRLLDIAGAETRAAASVEEALAAVDAFHPDVLLSEVGARGGPIQARALAAGQDAQLAKPVEPVALLATVARLAQPAGV